MLEQRHHRALRRRIRTRRQIAENFIHVEQGTQRSRAILRAHPTQHLVHQQAHEKHPLGITKVSDRKNRNPRLARRRVQHARNVERRTFQPCRKTRRCKQVVEFQGQHLTRLLRKERLNVDDTNLVECRLLNVPHQGLERDILPSRPGLLENGRKQNRFRAFDRIRCHTHQGK